MSERVYQRKNGKWEARYIKGKSPSGKTRYGTVFADTREEAILKRELLLGHNPDDPFSGARLNILILGAGSFGHEAKEELEKLHFFNEIVFLDDNITQDDEVSIAYYKYGSSIQKMLLQIVNTFTMVLVPRLSLYYKEKRKEEFNYLVSKGFKLIILFAIPMIIGIFFTSDFLIQKMYGSGYASSSVVLKYLSLLLLISPIGYLLGSRMLLVTGNESKMIIAVGIGAAVNVIGNALLIPEYQEYGATVASVLSEVMVMCVYVVLGKKYYILSGVKKSSIKTIIAGVLMAIYLAGCASLPFNGWLVLILQIIGSVVLYFTMLLLLKEDNAQQCYEIIIAKLSKWGK